MWKPKPGNLFNKHYAHVISSADAYVSGFFYVWFSLPPIFNDASLLHDVKQEDTEVISAGREEINRILVSTCTAVPTVPALALNKTQTIGMNNMKAGHVTNLDLGDTVSLRFAEIMDLPIWKILRYWCSVIRDYETGVSRLGEGNYTKDNFSACLLYWTTAPNGIDIQKIDHFSGVYPQKDSRDLFTSDYTTSEKMDVDVEFNVDRIRCDKDWMITKAKNLQSIIDAERQNILNVDGNIC